LPSPPFYKQVKAYSTDPPFVNSVDGDAWPPEGRRTTGTDKISGAKSSVSPRVGVNFAL
jgi:hypothetical protein